MNKNIILPAILENLEPLMEHIRTSALACGLDAKGQTQVELALEEVLVNVINYAYPQDQNPPGTIEVECSWDDQQILTIVVADQGAAFDPLNKPDPDTTLSIEERDIGGLGIYLTKKMMDQVTYDRNQGRNQLTMVKKNLE